jgi:hypothetical protein
MFRDEYKAVDFVEIVKFVGLVASKNAPDVAPPTGTL